MRLANYQGRATIVVHGHAVDVEHATGGQLHSDPMVLSHLEHHHLLQAVASSVDTADWPVLDEVHLGAPVPRPPKGFGVALNYRQHAIESGRDLPTEPHLFAKLENCVCGPFDEIVVPAGLTQIDYEAELVIVFGRTCKQATREAYDNPLLAVPATGEAVHRRQDVRHVRPHRALPGHRRRAGAA